MSQREELCKKVREYLKTFGQIGMSGRLTYRFIEDEVFMAGFEKILKEMNI